MTTTFNVANDYLVWDNREDVTVYSHATAGDTAYSITAPDSRGGAKRRPLKTGEVMASGGVYTKSDVIFKIPHARLPAGLVTVGGIKPSDRIVDAAGVDWTVLAAEQKTWATIWVLTCRALAIVNGLKDTADIYTPTNTPDVTGNRVPEYPGTPTYSAIACRLQEQTGDRLATQDKLAFTRRYTCFMAQRVIVTTETQVRIAGATYQVRSYANPDRIDELMSLDLEKLT